MKEENLKCNFVANWMYEDPSKRELIYFMGKYEFDSKICPEEDSMDPIKSQKSKHNPVVKMTIHSDQMFFWMMSENLIEDRYQNDNDKLFRVHDQHTQDLSQNQSIFFLKKVPLKIEYDESLKSGIDILYKNGDSLTIKDSRHFGWRP